MDVEKVLRDDGRDARSDYQGIYPLITGTGERSIHGQRRSGRGGSGLVSITEWVFVSCTASGQSDLLEDAS